MRASRWGFVAGATAFACIVAGSAMAAPQPSGVAIAVVQSAQANGQSGSRPLQSEAPVYSGDQIVTGAVGEAQVRFADNTKLVVGPNSRMVIDAFVFNNDTSARQFSINAVRGSFRFITGNSAKDAYAIRTPTATIGVRGTEFDFNVTGNGTTLALFRGSARVCDRATGRCILQSGGCSVSTSNPGRAPSLVRSARAQLDRMFRYIARQTNLRREFRVDTAACGFERVEAPAGGPSLSPLITGSTTVFSPSAPPPPSSDNGGRSNNGLGNGGEGNEGPTETGNPGNGGGNGNGNGGGNGNGNGGGNGNGNGNGR